MDYYNLAFKITTSNVKAFSCETISLKFCITASIIILSKTLINIFLINLCQ